MQGALHVAAQFLGNNPISRGAEQLRQQALSSAQAVQRSVQWRAASQGLEAAAGVAWRGAKAAPAVEQQLSPALAVLNPLGTLGGTLGRTPAAQQLSRQLIPQLAKTPVAQALQKIDRQLDPGDSARLAPQLGRQPAAARPQPQDKAARQQLVAAERALLAERAQYIAQVAHGQKNVVQRAMDGLREQFTYVTTGQRGVLDDAVKNYDASLQRIRATGQLFNAGKITAWDVRHRVQQTGQAFVSEDTRVRGVQAKQLEWGMAAAGVSRDVGAVVAATGVTIGTGGNVFLGAAAGYAAKEAGDLAIEAVGSTGGQSQRQMTAGRSWVYHVATQAPRGNLGSWRDARQALVREGGDLAWSTVDALGANFIWKATTTLALRWAPQIFRGANPALKLQFMARGGLRSGGVYQQALPGLLTQRWLSTALASATAATTWQLRRGVGEVAVTATQVAGQGQLFTAQGRKTIGNKAFEQVVALPFASLSTGAAALLPNAGRFAIASQALSDTSFGVVEGQITTRQREGRWMNELELFTRTYASGLGSANNLILHPNNLLRAQAAAAPTTHSGSGPASPHATSRSNGDEPAADTTSTVGPAAANNRRPGPRVPTWANQAVQWTTAALAGTVLTMTGTGTAAAQLTQAHLPAASPAHSMVADSPLAAPSAYSKVKYTVQPGDTVWEISNRLGSTPEQMVKHNPQLAQDPDLILPGQALKVPAPANGSGPLLASPSPITAETPIQKIAAGDTLEAIARDTLGDSRRWPDVWALNRAQVPDPDLILPGQQLTLPKTPRLNQLEAVDSAIAAKNAAMHAYRLSTKGQPSLLQGLSAVRQTLTGVPDDQVANFRSSLAQLRDLRGQVAQAPHRGQRGAEGKLGEIAHQFDGEFQRVEQAQQSNAAVARAVEEQGPPLAGALALAAAAQAVRRRNRRNAKDAAAETSKANQSDAPRPAAAGTAPGEINGHPARVAPPVAGGGGPVPAVTPRPALPPVRSAIEVMSAETMPPRVSQLQEAWGNVALLDSPVDSSKIVLGNRMDYLPPKNGGTVGIARLSATKLQQLIARKQFAIDHGLDPKEFGLGIFGYRRAPDRSGPKDHEVALSHLPGVSLHELRAKTAGTTPEAEIRIGGRLMVLLLALKERGLAVPDLSAKNVWILTKGGSTPHVTLLHPWFEPSANPPAPIAYPLVRELMRTEQIAYPLVRERMRTEQTAPDRAPHLDLPHALPSEAAPETPATAPLPPAHSFAQMLSQARQAGMAVDPVGGEVKTPSYDAKKKRGFGTGNGTDNEPGQGRRRKRGGEPAAPASRAPLTGVDAQAALVGADAMPAASVRKQPPADAPPAAPLTPEQNLVRSAVQARMPAASHAAAVADAMLHERLAATADPADSADPGAAQRTIDEFWGNTGDMQRLQAAVVAEAVRRRLSGSNFAGINPEEITARVARQALALWPQQDPNPPAPPPRWDSTAWIAAPTAGESAGNPPHSRWLSSPKVTPSDYWRRAEKMLDEVITRALSEDASIDATPQAKRPADSQATPAAESARYMRLISDPVAFTRASQGWGRVIRDGRVWDGRLKEDLRPTQPIGADGKPHPLRADAGSGRTYYRRVSVKELNHFYADGYDRVHGQGAFAARLKHWGFKVRDGIIEPESMIGRRFLEVLPSGAQVEVNLLPPDRADFRERHRVQITEPINAQGQAQGERRIAVRAPRWPFLPTTHTLSAAFNTPADPSHSVFSYLGVAGAFDAFRGPSLIGMLSSSPRTDFNQTYWWKVQGTKFFTDRTEQPDVLSPRIERASGVYFNGYANTLDRLEALGRAGVDFLKPWFPFSGRVARRQQPKKFELGLMAGPTYSVAYPDGSKKRVAVGAIFEAGGGWATSVVVAPTPGMVIPEFRAYAIAGGFASASGYERLTPNVFAFEDALVSKVMGRGLGSSLLYLGTLFGNPQGQRYDAWSTTLPPVVRMHEGSVVTPPSAAAVEPDRSDAISPPADAKIPANVAP